jgi:dual specificity tyrosine-phosphorylation-regulated kinase 2/3/4
MNLIKKIGYQLITALKTLETCNIIHCDIKPENILLVNLTRHNAKLIDLGSSCFGNKRIYTYIQSRFYRAPEIILGIPYTNAIDMWSLGCVLAEMHSGLPLFPGENDADQLLCIMEILGLPPFEVLKAATRKDVFFEADGQPKIKSTSKGRRRVPGARSLKSILKGADDELYQFIKACLNWDSNLRLKPGDALKIEWFHDKVIDISRNSGYKHKKISLEDITKHVPNLQKYIAYRNQLSLN